MSSIKSLIQILLFSSLSLYSKAQVTNGLILHYSFDSGSALDEVGSNNGTINGATTCPDRFGNPDMAFNFSSNNISADPVNLGNTTEGSISVWLDPDLSTFNGSIASPVQLEACTALFINRYASDGRVLVIMDASSGNNTPADQSNPINQNDWTHIVATSDGSTTKLYINGVLENSYSETFNWIDGGYLILGHAESAGLPEQYYNGKMDDFRIYNRALNSLEIDSLFNMPNPTANLFENEISDGIIIYPNPTTNSFKINSPQLEVNSVEIVDMLGTKVLMQTVDQQSVIDLTPYANGVYIVRLTGNNGYIGTVRVIKSKLDL